MRVLVAMSGGVDSSVSAAELVDQGHEVVGATMKLWGGAGDSGCCSVADVYDARRVADHLGIDHHVFNFTEPFTEHVVDPYVEAHRLGATPNPCVECNRHLKFSAFLERALRLGYDAIATGHHARVLRDPSSGGVQLARGADPTKDQSYVLSVLTERQLHRIVLPVGTMLKSEVRSRAKARGLLTADKPDSQDVCFIASRTKGLGRGQFLSERIPLHASRVVDRSTGRSHGEVPAVELVTIGQRRGLGTDSSSAPRYVVDIDVDRRVVTVGDREDLLVEVLELTERTWVHERPSPGTRVLVQSSAHGPVRAAALTESGIRFEQPTRRVARGQIVACYLGDVVIGSGVVAS